MFYLKVLEEDYMVSSLPIFSPHSHVFELSELKLYSTCTLYILLSQYRRHHTLIISMWLFLLLAYKLLQFIFLDAKGSFGTCLLNDLFAKWVLLQGSTFFINSFFTYFFPLKPKTLVFAPLNRIMLISVLPPKRSSTVTSL